MDNSKSNHVKSMLILGLLSISILIISLISNVFYVEAAGIPRYYQSLVTPTPFPEISSYEDSATFLFKDLDWTEGLLYYTETATLNVDLPDFWTIHSEASYIDIYYDYEDPEGSNISASSMPYVEIKVNDYYAGRFIPSVGNNQHYRAYLPYQSIVGLSEYTDNSHKELGITFTFFDRDINPCLYNGVLNIHDDSLIGISFTPTRPYRGSWTFPYPLIQESFLPETLLFIMPDEYNDSDLTAAMQLSATIGAVSSGNIRYKLITASDVTDDDLKKSSAIIIGQASKNSIIQKLYSKGYLSATNYNDGLIRYIGKTLDTAGYIHLLPSYVNNIYSLLVVTGNSDAGVASAVDGIINSTYASKPVSSIAFSNLNVPVSVQQTLTGFTSSYAIIPAVIDQIQDTAPQLINEYSSTFGQLNFRSQTFVGTGEKDFALQFYIPRNWIINDNAKVILNYGYSRNIEPNVSSFAIYLNEVPLTTVPYDDPIQGYRAFEIPINPDDFLYGSVNTLRFSLLQGNEDPCLLTNPSDYWTYIRDDSLLYLEYALDSNLSGYIIDSPFDYLSNESRILVIAPIRSTTEDLDNLVTISAMLGSNAISYNPLDVKAISNYEIDLDEYKNYNVLVYGSPSNNPFIKSINEKLPQQFDLDQGTLKTDAQSVDFHIPQDVDIGLIEVIPIAEDYPRGITIVSGTTMQGIQYIMDNIVSVFENKLGNLLYVNKNGVITQSEVEKVYQEEQAQMVGTPEKTEQSIYIKPTATTFERSTIQTTVIPGFSRDLANNASGLTYWILGISILVLCGGVIWYYRIRR